MPHAAPGTSPVADESVFTGAVASKDVVPDDFFIGLCR